ncbi:hypothetical protein ACKX2L_10470 [Lachnospiraceae bacterium YH-ros2228]
MESDGNKKEEIIKAATSMEFYPVEIVDQDKAYEGYKKIPLTEISGLGSMFAEMVPSLRTVTSTTKVNVEGLYKCTFPQGVKGTLAQFKDGSGSLGTIMKNNNIVGQARWNPAGPVSATQSIVAPVSPVSMFMAAALIEINHKIDNIQKTADDILDYLQEKDRATQKANYDELLDVYNKFKFNLTDTTWQIAKYHEVQDIRREASAQIKQLHTRIEKTMDRHDLVHFEQQTRDMVAKVQGDFYYYRLGVFMYSFATFLEILLHGKFDQEYLASVKDDVAKIEKEYEDFYDECYRNIEHSSTATVESKALKGISGAASNVGKFIHGIPVIEKGPVDELLSDAGEKLNNYNNKHTTQLLEKFSEKNDSGARQFEEGIENLSRQYNSPMEVLVDKDNVYIKLEGAQ